RLASSHLDHRWVMVAAAPVAAVAMALDLPWGIVWVSWLVAGVAGVLAVWPAATSDPGAEGPTSRREGWFVLACAVGLAMFSTVTLRPNPDDLYYVNLSQCVAEHGYFPVRDTIFGDLTYPMSNWPPLASYDAFTGALAHVLGLRAGDVVYVVVPPVATVLAPVLALAGAAPLVRRAPRHALLGFAAMAAYPLVAGAATLVLGGRSADDFADRRQYRFDPDWFGHAVFLTDLLALVAVLA